MSAPLVRVVLALAGLTACLTGTVPAADPPAGPTAAEVWDGVGKTYAGAKSYRDEGKLEATFVDLESKSHKLPEVGFITRFVRPGRLFLAYHGFDRDFVTETVVWVEDGKARVRVKRGDNEVAATRPSLAEALARTATDSGYVSFLVPRLLGEPVEPGLLSPVVPAKLDPRPQNLKRLEDAKEGGADCYRVGGDWWAPVTVWVDKQTRLVRRADWVRQLRGGRFEFTIRYTPELNADIPERLLVYPAGP